MKSAGRAHGVTHKCRGGGWRERSPEGGNSRGNTIRGLLRAFFVRVHAATVNLLGFVNVITCELPRQAPRAKRGTAIFSGCACTRGVCGLRFKHACDRIHLDFNGPEVVRPGETCSPPSKYVLINLSDLAVRLAVETISGVVAARHH